MTNSVEMPILGGQSTSLEAFVEAVTKVRLTLLGSSVPQLGVTWRVTDRQAKSV